MARIRAACLLTLLLLCSVGSVRATELYQWTDESGVTHFATSLEDVPAKYRNQIKTMESVSTPEATGRTPTVETPAAAAAETGQVGRFEVPYEAFEGSARRIIVDVTFNDRVTAPMALDTGSPGLVISFELAQKLDLFSRDNGALLTEAAGIGGSMPAILTIIDSVSVEDARDTFIPTTVTVGISEAFDGLIGMDFLTNYTISIDSQRHVLVFQETPPNPASRGGHDEAWWRQTFKELRAARDHWDARARSFEHKRDSNQARLAKFQARESARLLQRLDLYASDNAVPRHWR